MIPLLICVLHPLIVVFLQMRYDLDIQCVITIMSVPYIGNIR
jgi:hypothetical protein